METQNMTDGKTSRVSYPVTEQLRIKQRMRRISNWEDHKPSVQRRIHLEGKVGVFQYARNIKVVMGVGN